MATARLNATVNKHSILKNLEIFAKLYPEKKNSDVQADGKIKNGRQPQYFGKWKTTLIFSKCKTNLILGKLKMTSFCKIKDDLNL